ncbi:MAG: zinc-ribbon domain-containing protein [Nitrososphaerota archaeon]|nr:zinc-ribbon domain-containing protein [Nitrososphaerota archaeon]
MSQDNTYCSSCGASLIPGAAYCAKCGARVGVAHAASAPPPVYRGREYRREKQEKQEKGEKQERGRRGSLIGPIIGGLILIWLGVTFFLQQSNYIPSDAWWAYFITGIGVILVAQGLVGYVMNRRAYFGPIIGGAVLILIGLGSVTSWNLSFWPLIFVVLGILIMLSSLTARRRTPTP